MPFIVGIFIIPVILWLMKILNSVKTQKKVKIVLNIVLFLISIIYVIWCLNAQEEPFAFGMHYSTEYMFYSGEYFLYSGLVVMFTPFIWMIIIHFVKSIYKKIKIKTNARIKKDEEYIYYRDDLDKIPPSTIMFTASFDLDIKKCVHSTILKLKLTDYIKENNGKYEVTNKDDKQLLKSERMVLNLIKNGQFDSNDYKKKVEQEALKEKYIVKNNKGTIFKLIKILIAICIPIIIVFVSIYLDDYMFENYHVFPENDGHAYIYLKQREDIESVYKELQDNNDIYNREMADGSMSYSYNHIRADKFQYSVVRKVFILTIITVFLIGFIAVFVLIVLYYIIQQIRYIKKEYRRTLKGNTLINKAYALKNYLKEYSLIKDRTEEELVLWEYYLVYAVALGVNEKMDDEITKKYTKLI